MSVSPIPVWTIAESRPSDPFPEVSAAQLPVPYWDGLQAAAILARQHASLIGAPHFSNEAPERSPVFVVIKRDVSVAFPRRVGRRQEEVVTGKPPPSRE